MRLIEKIVMPTGKSHSGTLIFFHGSGDSGHNLVERLRYLLGRDLDFPHLKIIFPTAPVQKYSLNGGQDSNVWFDRKVLNIEARESRSSLASIYETVKDLLKREIASGIPMDRIIVGGFSMGGALSLHTAYHVEQNLAGVFACSSFLNDGSIVYDSIKNRSSDQKLCNLLMFHGDRDDVVDHDWGRRSFDQLEGLGVQGEFITLKNTFHELKQGELLKIIEWVNKILPPTETDLSNKL